MPFVTRDPANRWRLEGGGHDITFEVPGGADAIRWRYPFVGRKFNLLCATRQTQSVRAMQGGEITLTARFQVGSDRDARFNAMKALLAAVGTTFELTQPGGVTRWVQVDANESVEEEWEDDGSRSWTFGLFEVAHA